MDCTKYTSLENVPETIGINEIYCYYPTNGVICIGEILGKSIGSKATIIRIGELIVKTFDKIEDGVNSIIVNHGRIKCYNDYNTLAAEYKANSAKKKLERAARKKHYSVNTTTFYCKETSSSYMPYHEKWFDTKKEAEEYANKGLEKFKKSIPKLIDECSETKELVHNLIIDLRKEGKLMFDKEPNYAIYFRTHQVKFRELKENDVIFKVTHKVYGDRFTINEIADDATFTVKSFVTPRIAKLSNGEILMDEECHDFYYYSMYKMIEQKMKMDDLRRTLSLIDHGKDSLDKLLEYAKSYTPFNKKIKEVNCNFNYLKAQIKDIKMFLKDYNKDENLNENNYVG